MAKNISKVDIGGALLDWIERNPAEHHAVLPRESLVRNDPYRRSRAESTLRTAAMDGVNSEN